MRTFLFISLFVGNLLHAESFFESLDNMLGNGMITKEQRQSNQKQLTDSFEKDGGMGKQFVKQLTEGVQVYYGLKKKDEIENDKKDK